MTTKDQERKALAQIRKIVDGLGEDSYLAAAFEGCFEIAEENIANDWACSLKQQVKSKNEQIQAYVNELNELKDENNTYKIQCEKNFERAEEAEARFNAAQRRIDDWVAKYNKAIEIANERTNSLLEQQVKAVTLETENTKLKAKLYDLMTAGQ